MRCRFGYKNSGFTLAEILITLGIVGVVAAMTIPTLMMNYQTRVWEARLKKSFSVTVNACERMLVEENVSASNETRIYEGANNDIVRRYFKILRDGENTTINDNAGNQIAAGFLIALPDGADILFNPVAADAVGGPGFNFFVDVNGRATNPNQPGRDLFEFNLDRNCTYTFTEDGASQSAIDFNYVVDHNWELPDNPDDYPVAGAGD
jgi:prepilin-type N-terminal cleavage/methylation domain-containing protein